MDDYVDRNSIPLMPWDDLGCSFTDPPVQDVSPEVQNHQINKPLPNFVGERKLLSKRLVLKYGIASIVTRPHW